MVVVFALSPWYWLAAAIAAARGILVGSGIGLWDHDADGAHARADALARRSVDWFGTVGLLPLGYLLASGVSGLASPGVLLAAGAAAAGALFLAVLPARWLRAVD